MGNDDVKRVNGLHKMHPLRLRFWMFFAWASAILYLSLTSDPPQAPGMLGWDKLQHALAYGLLTLLAARLLAQWLDETGWRVLGSALVVSIFYGILIEILQLTVETGRAAEVLDVIADAVGALVVCVLLSHRSVAKFYRPKLSDNQD